ADIANTDGDPGPDLTLDNGDFTLFFSAFFADISNPLNLIADIANTDSDPGADGTVDNGDFTLFFAAFFAGCP
ncbi:MAG: GC-type dockerin domain-anchored protein, partial [Phycisphaerales bacterium]